MHHQDLIMDTSLKLFLEQDAVEKLHDFEEDCMEDYFKEKEMMSNASADEKLKVQYSVYVSILNSILRYSRRLHGGGGDNVQCIRRWKVEGSLSFSISLNTTFVHDWVYEPAEWLGVRLAHPTHPETTPNTNFDILSSIWMKHGGEV